MEVKQTQIEEVKIMKIKIQKGFIVINNSIKLIDNVANRKWLNDIINDAIKAKKAELCIIK